MVAQYSRDSSLPYFQGSARQRGSGLGSLALAVGRTAIPIFKRVILPVARSFGKNLLREAVPELLDVVEGKQNVRRATKRTVKRAARKQLGGNGPAPKRRRRTKRPKVPRRKQSKTKRNVTRKRSKPKRPRVKKQNFRTKSDLFANVR